MKTYAALYVLGSIFGIVYQATVQERGSILWSSVATAIFFVLLVLPIICGSRIGWVLVLIVTVASFFFAPRQYSDADRVIGAIQLVASVALLLHPQTQRWCRVRL